MKSMRIDYLPHPLSTRKDIETQEVRLMVGREPKASVFGICRLINGGKSSSDSTAHSSYGSFTLLSLCSPTYDRDAHHRSR